MTLAVGLHSVKLCGNLP